MEEENQQQVKQEPQQVTKEPQQVTMKDPKKVEAGKRLAAINRKKREVKKREDAQNGGMNQYYGIGAILAVGVIFGLGYYIYRTKKGQVSQEVPNRALQAPLHLSNRHTLRLTSLRWIKSLLFYKNGKEEYSK